MRKTAQKRARFAAIVVSSLAMACKFCAAQAQPTGPAPAASRTPELKLYCVGYSHLDTQWRWSYPQVIAEFLRNTLHDNFRLFDRYPDYIFNFTGANRYMMFREYYPQDYQTLKKYIAAGRWFPAGSSMEEGDVNMPDGEAIIRQVLYGNEFFRREFGKQSAEFMLPDCFGFQASLPSLLAHCGLIGFSTQKLTWGSAVGIPFNVGVWEGPDGRGIVAALNPGDYNSSIAEDLSHSKTWQQRIEDDGQKSGVYCDYRYYGAGDRGGAVHEDSIKWLEKSIAGGGPVHVISATSQQMFVDLTAEQIAALPRYKGDLLLTNHSAGSLTSEAYIKRCNRKNEQLADAAERVSVAADWLGSAPYPMEKIDNAWTLELGAHFHDTMAGTALPKSYEYSWNNEVLAMNQFAAAVEDGAGAVIRGMNTQVEDVAIAVFNPLSTDREDVAEATVTFPNAGGSGVSVFGPDGNAVPSQVESRSGNQVRILFLARAPSVGFAIYDVRQAPPVASASSLSVGENSLENDRFRVALNSDGDIASIYDKTNQRQVLSAPARLAFLYEKPAMYPAWNMDWKDRSRPPCAYVGGPCKIRIVEAGPVRVAIETQRESQGSRFVQQIRLAAGSAGDRIEVASTIDWQTHESSLEAVFPFSFGNPVATYESQSAAIQRGNNNPKKFEVPQQQWLDLTAADGQYGAAVLNDCKYGSDKPSDNTIRLTLLYTPGVRSNYQDQASQDFGRQTMVYALAPHGGSWQQAGSPWQAQRLNQPLMTFQASGHDGALGRSFSLLKVSNAHVGVTAIKKAEESDETIIRLHEFDGQDADAVQVSFAGPVTSAREVDGQERPLGPAVVENGRLVVNMTPFSLRAFAVKIAGPPAPLKAPVCEAVALPYNMDGISRHENLGDGAFDSAGHTIAAEGFPAKLVSEGIDFNLGPTADGQKNVLACRGQMIQLPDHGYDRVYLLAAAVDGDRSATFEIGGQPEVRTVEDWSGYIGQWDNRQWQGVVPGLTYNWANKFAGLVPGFIKRDTVAWFCSHRHDPSSGNEYYRFAYLFKYAFDLPAGGSTLKLPNDDRIRIFAITVARNGHDDVAAARPLYDTLQDHTATEAPQIVPDGGTFTQSTPVRIDHPLYWKEHDLHYTLDGSEPTIESPVYSQPILVVSPTTVRAREIDGDGQASPQASAELDVNDITPPTVLSASAMSVDPTVTISFSEPVRADQADRVENYQFQPPLELRSAQLSDDGLRRR